MFRSITFVLLISLLTRSNAFICEGDGFFADPTDCVKFYRCVSGTKFSFSCGPGTHFNPSHNGCDWPYNVNCQASGAEQPQRYKQKPDQDYGQQYSQPSGQDYSQYGQQYGQQYEQQQGQQLGQQYGQQSGAQSGQQPTYGQSGQSYGQYGQQPKVQSGQVYSEHYPDQQQSGLDYSQYAQPSGQQHGQQLGQQSGVQSGQQPPHREYGQQQYGLRQHQSHRLPEESQQIDSRQKIANTEDQSPYQSPNQSYNRRQQKTYPMTDRRGEEPPVESDRVYEEPNQRNKVRPKPTPKPKISREPTNELAEEDNQFDHNFDERIDERRPKPKPRPRPQPQENQRRRQPQTQDINEEDAQQEMTTTTRPKVPKRNYRIRTTTAVSPTEADDSSEEDFNQFSQFENEVQTKDDGNEETNKWINFEDLETTTTEDPFVSMLKSKVPPQTRNRSRIDSNRNYGPQSGTTTSSPIRTRVQTTTTVDPFDEEWVEFISGKNKQNGDRKPSDSSLSSKDNKRKTKPTKTTDPLLMADVISYYNCTEAGKSCDVCEELDWIKYSGIGLKSTPFRSYKFLPKIVSKQCYKACSDSQQCIGFTYSPNTGMCYIYDQLTTDDIDANEDFNTVIKNPKNTLMNDEWIDTKNGMISGDELYSVKTDNVWQCLHECVKDMENCLAINYDFVDSNCKIFDANQGSNVNKLKANSISLQHMSIFDDENQWRFQDIGPKTLANTQPMKTIEVQELEECLYECMENVNVVKDCSFVTMQTTNGSNYEDNDDEEYNEEKGNDRKLCHLFGYTSTPKWIESKDKSNNSYVMNVPKNHSRFQEYSGYTYVGNPLEIKEGMTEEECRQYAEENCDFCRKYTAILETKECALFSDSALLSPSLKDTNYTEKSGLISMPKDSEYMAFKRIPWKMFTTDVDPYELKGEINGQKCLQFCLQQKLCIATALVYDTAESSMFCYFFKESDLKNSNITEYENVDLFVRIMDEKEIPGHMSNNTDDDCSDGQPLDDAIKNVNDMDADLDNISPKKSSGDSDRYNSNNYPLSPHGYDYRGGPNEEDYEQNFDRNSRNQNQKLRNVRSVRNKNQRLESDDNDFESEVEKNRQTNENSLSFIESIRDQSRKKEILNRIPNIGSELRKSVKKTKLEAKTKTSSNSEDEERQQKKVNQKSKSKAKAVDGLTTDCEFDFETNSCKEVKDKSEMCSELPKIIYSDAKQMQSCNESLVGEECPVICRSGYEPTIGKMKCQKSGNRNVWKNAKQIKCKPIESECEAINRNETQIRINSNTRYPEEKLHFITRYDTNKKLPQFSVYVHTKENNINKTTEQSVESIRYVENFCELLEDKQLKVSDYKQSGYNPKPLLPKNAFSYSNEAQSLLNTITNIAPQDPFTSRGPWNTLENRTLEALKSRPGIVISGVCPQNIPKSGDKNNKYKKSDSIEIPECFWSIVCVPFGDSVTTAAFYAENSHPISQLEKQSRLEQIRQYRDQRFIIKLLGTELYRNVWVETYNAFKNLNKGIKSFIYKCAEVQKNSPEAVAFWDNIINGNENVEKWQTKFTYGLEKSDLELKKKTGSRNDGQQQRYLPKRRERDDQNINDEIKNNNSIEENYGLNEYKSMNWCKNKIIGYLTPFGEKGLTEREAIGLTHAIFAYIDINSEGRLGPFDGHSNENKLKFTKLYEMLALKTRLMTSGHKLKTMVSIGGWNNSEHFSSIAASVIKRTNFIANILSAIEYWNLDGIEIDWKYPVIGGPKPGQHSDRENFVLLLTEIRQELNAFARGRGLEEHLLLSITAASGHWIIEESYDLRSIVPIVDWINIMTYDYFGPWKSKWGANTGPNAPLYPSAPISSLSKMNIHSTLEKYFCLLNSTDKLIISIPFYGHYWNNVGQPIDTKDELFRDAHPVGGFVAFNNIKNKWLLNKDFEHLFHNKSFTPYLWSESSRVLLSYENSESIAEKVRYMIDHKLAGVSIWALDFDDLENELFNTIVDNYKKCQNNISSRKHKPWTDNDFNCKPTAVRKWWSTEDGINEGLCGRSAPLINGFYPICNPNSDSMNCCSSWGRCGSGPEFCECKGCVDYNRHPELIDKEPVRPTQEISWLTSDQLPDGEESEGMPICGYKAQQLNGSQPICNPDDDNSHCCSAEGLCGSEVDYCDCKQCVNFRKNPNFSYSQKLWWDQTDGLNRAGRCGKLAPKIEDIYPICNPNSESAYCCGKWGFCGSGPLSCECIGCVDFKRLPLFRWK